MLRIFLLLLCSSWFVPVAMAAPFDHSLWNKMLHEYVHSAHHDATTVVDYAGFSKEKAHLKSYLKQLSKVKQDEFDSWSHQEQLAFLINSYNAGTVSLVLTGYPKLQSIKDLGSFFRSPWSKSFIPLLGETRSLDDIEHQLIRGSGRYNEPRVHFAVNCASIGCPALRPEAYTAAKLDKQLAEQTKAFLSDRSRNRLEGDQLKVSSIFKWYRADFEKGWGGIHSLPEFFARYASSLSLSAQQLTALQNSKVDIEFLDYDWHLNAASVASL
ncbi:MAG: DUF547 domain-containing protein [Mariprofundus sp.]|nr:DUF547 domain-containing protein [Mariprofundus sp.]